MNILVLDDEPLMLSLFNTIISHSLQQAKVHLADDLAKASSLWMTHPIDLLICDLVLAQGEKGIDMVQQVRMNDQSTPIILVSGQTLDTEEFSRLNVNAFIQKPFQPDEVAATVKQFIRQSARGAF